MSRIAGFFAANTAPALRLSNLLEPLRASPAWQHQQITLPAASLGWCGWKSPIVYQTEGIAVVVDGILYNRHEFPPAANAAALICDLYQKHGFVAALQKLNGDFAIALYDSHRSTLWLGRDRFGIKPLYYTLNKARIAFASRPRALLEGVPALSREVNQRYVAIFAGSHYRYFDNHPEESPFAAISQLPPAHALRISFDAQGALRAQTERYWTLSDLPDFTDSEEALAERYRELMQDCVTRRFSAMSRPAFTLSGGMDSSSVLACAVQHSGRKQHAFSTVYEDRTYDESEDIRTILDSAVEQWHQVRVEEPDLLSIIGRMVGAHDEPVATATWLSHFLLSEQVAQAGFTGLLGGLGGDELNAGEYEYFLCFFADLKQAGQTQRLNDEIARWAEYHDHPIYKKSAQVVDSWFGRLIDFEQPGHIRADRQRLERYRAALNADYFDLGSFEPIMDYPFGSVLKNRTYQDLSRETMPCCLRAEDRQTTINGLDHALPFLDHRLAEFMYRVPGTLKYQAGVTKHLLRQAMRGVLPESTRTRVKKTGWNAPGHVWFSGKGKTMLLDLTHSSAFRQRGIYNLDEVERLIHEHDRIVSSGAVEENHMMFLWQLVNLELWLQQYG